jgi:predicted acylesterase/phospholipase RssA
LREEGIMAVRDIAIACQGGGSHAAYTGGVLPVLLGSLDNVRVAREADDALRLPDDPDVPVLVAISGTSGGAISALLGWYGFVTGGARDAERRLDAFWESNSALKWTESQVNHMARAAADMAAGMGWDIKSSPYALPMHGMELFASAVWPLLAHVMGPDNPWMRPGFFALPELLQPAVDWPLVDALGAFASIPLDVQRWQRSDLEAAMFTPDAPWRQARRAERARLQESILGKMELAGRIVARMDELGLGEDALLRAAFARWQPPPLRFDGAALAELARAVQRVTRHIPHLLVGAVELHQGEFVAFSSERAPGDGGISVDAVLASAAVPWLFRAHEMMAVDDYTLAPRSLVLWDGLFSQNPPIKNFLSGVLDDSKKPDEIWVVQINPTEARAQAGPTPAAPRSIVFSGGEIWDLRNALAGNLSLNQELGFVDAVNRRMEESEEGQAAGAARLDRQVRVDRIIMDGSAVEAQTGAVLGANSKLDRDPALRSALHLHGRLQAQRYLGLRSRIPELFDDLGSLLASTCASMAGRDPHDSYPAASVGRGTMLVDGATLYSVSPSQPGIPQALVRWRGVEAQVAGRPVRIEGRSELAEGPDSGTNWRLKEGRITALAPRGKAGKGAQAAWPSMPAGAGEEPVRPSVH